ncbi:MAG: sigma-70 family RNA polymerase sigma factor [Actinobacteria bacterium]|nr:sigma-70 family RNA polymerase sigma factor [Actinomycetota bacterium]
MEPDPLQSDARARGVEERRLLAQAQGGDLGAFEELVRIHAQRLHGVLRGLCANPHDAEEVAQEAFLRAWRAIGRFDGRSQFFTWLYRIGVNEARRRADREGARLRAVPLGEPPYEEPADLSEAPEPRAERRERRLALECAVRALPIEQRAALVLRDIEGLSTREAAEVLGLSEPAFKSRLHRARMSVREALRDGEMEEGGA